MTPRAKPCDNCRNNHLKCDGAKPKCSRCDKAGRECVRQHQTRYRFRHASSTHAPTYSPERELRYIDETPKYTVPQEAEDNAPVQGILAETASVVTDFRDHSLLNQVQSARRVISRQPSVHKREPIHLPLPRTRSLDSPYQVDLGEAFLLRYFVEELAKWFDICDPDRHFAVVVPQRVRICQPLFNAVLSASARHFTTLPDYKQKEKINKLGLQQDLIISEAAVLDYHSRCIAHLRFLANEPDAIMDENLLAAAVVLRFYEELDSPFIDIPTDVATRGLHVFIEAQASLALSSKGLRNRWLERRPPALFPVYSEPPEREQGFIFPQKWFLNDCHIVAEQTLGLLEILLTAYDPSVARIGPGQRIAMESTDARLKCTVLDICGTALSNRQEPTALLTACIAIGICGDRFTGLAEQKALMDIVINSVRDNNYWPSNALAEKLRKAWGWAD